MSVTERLNCIIPSASELPFGADGPDVAISEAQFGLQYVFTDIVDDCGSFIFRHGEAMTNFLSLVKTSDGDYRQKPCHGTINAMGLNDKPFGDIAERLRWHRELEGLTQQEYATKIGQKRAALNNWESGDYRLSLNAALQIRKTYGLSLDFMYEGIDDALSMTLRKAWRDRP